ncbi:MAG: mucoidy inhibitor MuiA family protein [Chloroflexota bacterium]
MFSLETVLKSVTIYPDRARLTRSGALSLEPGNHTIEIAELPTQLDANSLRASAQGTARARLLGVQARTAYYAETPAEQVRHLEEQLEALQDEAESLAARMETIQQQRSVLDALGANSKVFARALANGKLSLDAHLSMVDGLRTRIEALDSELQKRSIEKRRLERRSQKIANDLKQLGAARQRQRLSALVEIEVLQAGDLAFELTYVTMGCGWKPLYDLRLWEDGKEPVLEVGYLAQVTQCTAETWDGVALSLSTARPALAGKVPELDPWYVQPHLIEVPQSQMAKRRAVSERAVLSAEADVVMAAAPAPMPAEVVTARVDSSGAAVTYHVPGTVTIPGDGEPHKVTAAQFSLQPDLDYVSAPKLVEAAYRRARVVNESDYLLLPGAANLFAGEAFIGTTTLELTPPQGEIELYLGVDDRVKTERELKRRDVGKNLIGGKRRMAYSYEITLQNLLSGPIELTLHDQLPVSRHEDIKIKLESADPKPAEQTALNLLNWELTLASKEKRTVRFDFSVEMPQAVQVVGLP